MAIIHINKESLVKKWEEFYGEDFSKENQWYGTISTTVDFTNML